MAANKVYENVQSEAILSVKTNRNSNRVGFAD